MQLTPAVCKWSASRPPYRFNPLCTTYTTAQIQACPGRAGTITKPRSKSRVLEIPLLSIQKVNAVVLYPPSLIPAKCTPPASRSLSVLRILCLSHPSNPVRALARRETQALFRHRNLLHKLLSRFLIQLKSLGSGEVAVGALPAVPPQHRLDIQPLAPRQRRLADSLGDLGSLHSHVRFGVAHVRCGVHAGSHADGGAGREPSLGDPQVAIVTDCEVHLAHLCGVASWASGLGDQEGESVG